MILCASLEYCAGVPGHVPPCILAEITADASTLHSPSRFPTVTHTLLWELPMTPQTTVTVANDGSASGAC